MSHKGGHPCLLPNSEGKNCLSELIVVFLRCPLFTWVKALFLFFWYLKSRVDVKFYKILFFHLWKWSHGFLMQCIHTVNSTDWFLKVLGWTVLGWTPCDHDVLTFSCMISFTNILLRIFVFGFMRNICPSFSFLIVSLVLVSGQFWPHKIYWEAFPLLSI